jgi:hypothetical protein
MSAVLNAIGAPRSTKMGTIASLWRYELGTQCRDSVADLATPHDFVPLSNIARILGRATVNGHSHRHGAAPRSLTGALFIIMMIIIRIIIR